MTIGPEIGNGQQYGIIKTDTTDPEPKIVTPCGAKASRQLYSSTGLLFAPFCVRTTALTEHGQTLKTIIDLTWGIEHRKKIIGN